MRKINRYLPELVYNKIQKINYKNLDHLYIICDMIIRRSIFIKEETDYSNKFRDIPRVYFTDLITRPSSYSKAMEILIDNDIVISDNEYYFCPKTNSGKALGYKFNSKLISKLISVEVKSKPLTKRIIKKVNEYRELKKSENKFKGYKEHFLNTFKIDDVSALKYIEYLLVNSLGIGKSVKEKVENNNKVFNRYNYLYITIMAIKDGELFFRRNKTNNRIDTNLTNLPSELRQFIISEKPLVNIDIVNSQPMFLALEILERKLNQISTTDNHTTTPSYTPPLCLDIFPRCPNEMVEMDFNDYRSILEEDEYKFIELSMSGKIYEYLQGPLSKEYNKQLTRKEIKPLVFQIFYSQIRDSKRPKKVFSILFPSVMNYIRMRKQINHNQFAIGIQRTESEMCIDTICKELDLLNIPYYTIHDSWVVDEDKVDEVMEVIRMSFFNRFGVIPKLDKERMNDKNNKLKI